MMDFSSRKRTLIMGILNVTPDSFYDGGRHFHKEKAIERAYELYREGADIIDIGGESTRPGAEPVSISEEIDRVCPVIESVSSNIGIPVSVDTYKSKVAAEALKCGAKMVNDISGLSFDEEMAGIVSINKSYLVLMHIQGNPRNMQVNPHYNNLLEDICTYLENACNKAINSGIDRKKIIIDPGIGFGKTLEDNYKILANIDRLKSLGYPLLIGISRKSLIGRLYDGDYNRLFATIALNSISVMKGADIIRVHDVEAHRLALKSVDLLKGIISDGSSI